MSDIGGLQLLPNQKQTFRERLTGKGVLIEIACGILLMIAIAYVILTIMTNRRSRELKGIDEQLVSINRNRNTSQEESLLTVQKQLSTIGSLMSAHVMWSATLAKLERSLEPKIKFVSFSGSAAEQTLSIHALADSYTTVAQQIAALYALDSVVDIKISKISTQTNGLIDATMVLKFKPGTFMKQSHE